MKFQSVSAPVFTAASCCVILAVLVCAATQCYADCNLDQDVFFTEGQLIQKVGLMCINSTSYDGNLEVCGRDGDIDRIETQLSCPEETPYCVQCGSRRRGGALCLSTPSTDLDCSSFSEDYNDEGCLVGEQNEVIPVGEEAYPTTMVECVDSRTFMGMIYTCGEDWYVDTSYEEISCPQSKPYCVEEDGHVNCVGPDISAGANVTDLSIRGKEEEEDRTDLADQKLSTLITMNITPDNDEDGIGRCVALDNQIFIEGEEIRTIGMECTSETTFEGHLEVCGRDGDVDRPTGEFTCPQETPYCVQCGPRRRGGALCLSTPTTDLDCFFPEDYNDDGCLVGERNEVVLVGETLADANIISCIDSTSYAGLLSTCGENWYVDHRLVELTCPEALPYCEERDGYADCIEGDTFEDVPLDHFEVKSTGHKNHLSLRYFGFLGPFYAIGFIFGWTSL